MNTWIVDDVKHLWKINSSQTLLRYAEEGKVIEKDYDRSKY